MNALTVTRRLTRATLGAGVVAALALTGHLALAHASKAASANPSGQSSSRQPPPGTSGTPRQPQPGQGQTRTDPKSGFSQTPGMPGRSSGSGSTTTHGS